MGALFHADVLHPLETCQIERRDRGLELVQADAVAARVHEEALAQHDAEFVHPAWLLGHPFVDEASADLARALRGALVVFLALHANPARESHEAARAARVRDVELDALAGAVAVARFGL